MSRTVLVTGGAGYIGAHACKLLASFGFQPVVYDDFSTGHRSFVRWGPMVEGDVRDGARLEAALRAHRPEVVMHFAAKSLVAESLRQPDLYKDVNAGGTATLVHAMKAAGCHRLVLSSSCAVYGDAQSAPISEAQAIAPTTPYGASKAEAERVASASSVQTIALRYFNAVGADPDGEIFEWHDPETHLIPIVLDAAAGSRPAVSIYGRSHPTPDGTAVRDYVNVLDIAMAHVLAARRLLQGSDSIALNLGSGSGTSVDGVIRGARQVTRRAIHTIEAPVREGDAPSLTADPRLASAILGWRPRRSDLATMIGDAWACHPIFRRAAA